jgi:hypothetical protein
MSIRLSGNRSSRSNKAAEWNSSDYSQSDGFPVGTDYLRPNLMFNSPLALSGPLFKPTGDISYKKYTPSSLTVPPITGPYPYNKGWEAWGGDDKYLIGDTHYGNFICSFGTIGVMSTQSYYESGGQNKIAKAKLNRIMKNSHLNFSWFAGLVDGNGKEIAFDPKRPSGVLKSMIKMLIMGDEPIDLKKLFAQLDRFIVNIEDQSIIDELKYYTTSLRQYLDKVLLKRIEVIPWQEMINSRRKGMLYMYQWFEIYRENPAKHKHKINEYIQDFIDTANQMAAFFGILIHVSFMLDCLLDSMGHSGPVIPSAERAGVLENIINQLPSLFMINTILYRDLADLYTRPNVDDNVETILQIEITQLDHCDTLSELLGLTLAIFHALVQGRKLYDAF